MARQHVKATFIQAHVRGWLARRRYKKIMRGIILLQAHYRRRKARKSYKIMKIESKSAEHQRQLNKGLENKIISLQQTIEKLVSRQAVQIDRQPIPRQSPVQIKLSQLKFI